MYAVAFAISGAVLVGVGEFSAHFGLRRVRPLFGVFLGSCYQVLTLLAVLAIRGAWDPGDRRGAALFFLVGIFHPGAYFLVLLNAIDRLGPARAITVRATSPIFAVALAVLFLAERPGVLVYLGLPMIVGAVMFLTKGGGGGDGSGQVRRAGWLFAVSAAFFSGLVPVLVKAALSYGGDPILGVLFTMMGGLTSIVIANSLLERKTAGPFWVRRIPPRAVLLFLPMGVLTGLAFITFFLALSLGTVSVVMPLLQSSPLVAILMSRIFLRSEERIDSRLVLCAVAVVLGAALVALGRT